MRKTVPRKKAFLLDFDGTILNNGTLIYFSVCHVFKRSGVEEPTYEDFCTNFKAPYLQYYKDRGVHEPEEVIISWFNEKFRSEECPLFPGVKETLNTLYEQGFLLAIISANYRDVVLEKCCKENLSQYLCRIVGRTKSVDADKKVSHIIDFCASFNVAIPETIFVGDSISDMIDGREAGVTPVGFTGSNASADILRKHGALYCVDAFLELTDIQKN